MCVGAGKKSGDAYGILSTRVIINAYRLLGGTAFSRLLLPIKNPAASNGVSNLQRCRAAGYLTLAAVAKCLQAATWLVARGNKHKKILETIPFFLK